MAVINGKKYTSFSNVNAKDGVFRFGSVLGAAMDGASDMAIYTRGTSLYFWNGAAETQIGAAGSGGVTTLDSLYDLDKSLTIDDGTLTLALTGTSGDGLTVTGGASATGSCIQITNAGSGADITGTSSTWAISKAGVITANGLTVGDDDAITFGATSDATIQWVNGSSFLDIAGAVNFDGNVTIESAHTLTLAGAGITVTSGDSEFSDGSLTIVDDDDAYALEITNATATTGSIVGITADAITEGSMLYLDNGEGSLTSGFYINCNDDGTSDFTVGADGATTITTAVNSTKALVVTGIQTSENLVKFDNTTGVIASGYAVLLLDAGGAIASGGNILRVAPTGTPNAGAIGIEYVGAGKTNQALYIDGDPTGAHLVQFHCGGALTNGYGVLGITNDGNLATGGNLLNLTVGGTPNAAAIAFEIAASGKDCQAVFIDSDAATDSAVEINGGGAIADNKAVVEITADGTPAAAGANLLRVDGSGLTADNHPWLVEIDGHGKAVQGLYIDADPTTLSLAYMHTDGAMAADKAVLELNSEASASNADSAVLRVEQGAADGVAWPLLLKQDDQDKGFVNYEGTSAADQTKSISTVNGDGDVEGPKNFSSSAGWAYAGMLRCAVNGTDGWIPYYTADTS